MHPRTLILPALLAHAAGTLAQGLPDGGGAEAPQLDPVNVTARRSIEQRFFAAGSLVVVDRQDIEQLGAFSVADVLRQLPGVVVTTSGDGSVEIRMRGMDRGATQLLVDGQRVGGGRSQLPLDQLPAELLERIEVVRAPTAEFSGATGGTLNIVLRQASVRRETNVRLTDNHVWGRNAGQVFFSRTGPLGGAPAPDDQGDAQAPAPAQPWSTFIALSSIGTVLGSDTQRRVGDASGSTDSDARGRYRRREVSVVPRLSGRLGPSDQLALRGTFSDSRFVGTYDTQGTRTPAAGAAAPFASQEDHRFERRYAHGAADWTHRFTGSKLETSVAASQAREDIGRTGITQPSLERYAFEDQRREDLWSASTKLSGTRSPLLWNAGAQVERRSLSVDNQTGATRVELDAVLDRHVLWGQNEWEVLGGSTLTAGLRAETLRIHGASATTALAERRSSFLQPSLHLRVPLADDLQWRVNLARVTRQPRIWDLVDRRIPSQGGNSLANPDYVGNPSLEPETAWTLDTGFERRLAVQGQVGLNLFVRRTSDTIAAVVVQQAGRWTEQRINVGDAMAWGLEMDAKAGLAWLGLPRDWTLSANASLLESRMTSGINEGERIPGQPRYTASITVAKPIRRTGGVFGGGTLSLTGSADLATSPGIGGRDGSRAMLDLYVGQVVRGWGYWRVGVFNIGDARYERRRHASDAGGARTASTSSMRLTPRLYLTVGTQF